ncbi:MAG: hypothetical protein F4Z35_05775 [Dehalococcoidia bacterium]|nr:hypothetical protein [Dehalococcoidia bacterium]
MDIVKRIVGVILVISAIVLAVHTVAEPLYFDSSTTGSGYNESVWALINSLTAFAVVLGVIFGFVRMRKSAAEGDAPVTREFLAANTQFFGVLFLGIFFFFNWFNLLSADFNAVGPDAVGLIWITLDAGLPLIWFPMGLHLLKGDS